MKEYHLENGKSVCLKDLEIRQIPKSDWEIIHKNVVIVCHDVFIEYNDGIVLVTRNNNPVKGELWPIGERALKGVPLQESLKVKALAECGLELYGMVELGAGRTCFVTAPFDHGKGTDSVNFVYFAKRKGELKLDGLHANPLIVSQKDYDEEFRKKLHPYVRDFMDLAMKQLSKTP